MFSRSNTTGLGFRRIFNDATAFATAFIGLVAAILTLATSACPTATVTPSSDANLGTTTPQVANAEKSRKDTNRTADESSLADIDDVKLKQIFMDANQFISLDVDRFSKYLKSATSDVWFVGTTFYVIADDFSDLIVSRLKNGINVNFIILDPSSDALNRSAKMLGYSNEEMAQYCKIGLESLLKIRKEIIGTKYENNLSIFLSSEQITARLYFFDPNLKTGFFYLIPQINGMNSQKLPGFLFANDGRQNIHLDYFQGAQRMKSTNELISITEWLERSNKLLAQKE